MQEGWSYDKQLKKTNIFKYWMNLTIIQFHIG